MNKYIIKLDEKNNITCLMYTFDYSEADIELSEEEYERAKNYTKFNPTTREFSEKIELPPLPKTDGEKLDDLANDSKTITNDNLVNMDMIVSLDEKLDKIIKHLGI